MHQHKIRIQGEQKTTKIEETKKDIPLLKNLGARSPDPEWVNAELFKNGTNKIFKILTEVFA